MVREAFLLEALAQEHGILLVSLGLAVVVLQGEVQAANPSVRAQALPLRPLQEHPAPPAAFVLGVVRRKPPDSSSLPADTAFLLSDAHVTAMLQCLEAVEQNNPRLLAQIDTSMVS